MNTSLLDTAGQYLTPAIVERLAAFTGESPTAAARATGAAAPAVLAGMLHSAQDPNGLSRLVHLLQQGRFDGSMLDNLNGAFTGSAMDGLMKTGGPLLGSLFGARSNGLVALVAEVAGISKASAMSLLSAVAPLVMSAMGRQLLAQGGITASRVRDLLASQRDAIAAAAPAGLGQALGIGDPTTPDGQPAQRARGTAAAGTGVRRLLPILLGIALLFALFGLLRSCGRSPETTTPPRDTLNTMAPTAPSGVTTVAASASRGAPP